MTTVIPGIEAAQHLEGADLERDWKIGKKIDQPTGGTGGHFSVCYFVQNKDGRQAFLKALNLEKALAMPGDTLRQIEMLIKTFNFERETLALCRTKKLRRIAAALDDGVIRPAGSAYPVYYIIFELAQGDIRKQMRDLLTFDLAWCLRTLHHTTVALSQLHTSGIAHQDLKPSNVLVYAGNEAKVSDLGSADQRGSASPRGSLHVAGDRTYAPPELLYHELSADWCKRRLGCDLYLLGNFVAFMFTGVTLNAMMYSHLDRVHRPGFWPHDYRTVLPYVRDAFGKAIAKLSSDLPECVREEIVLAVQQLCDPDPNHRGNPSDSETNPFSLERYVSLFNRLALRAEHGLIEV
jgi:serine/threonine protein kinase